MVRSQWLASRLGKVSVKFVESFGIFHASGIKHICLRVR